MTERAPPSEAVLAESRARTNVPASWVWLWCANPRCRDFVWVDPEALAAAGKLVCASVCSAPCALAILEGMGKP